MRTLTADFQTHATAATNRPILLFEGVFASSTLRLWTGVGDLSWNAQTWLGNGWLGIPEGGEERDEVEAIDLTVPLAGVPASVLALVLGDQKQGAAGSLYIGFLDANGAVVADPYLWWQGKYSHAEIREGGDGADVALSYETHLVDFDRQREFRWTREGQQFWFAGDKGFDYVVAAANWHGDWGGERQKPGKDNRKKSGKRKGRR